MNVALVLAGGAGTRLGENIPKQYIAVKGKPIIAYALKMFMQHPAVDAIQVVADAEWHEVINMYIADSAKFRGYSKPGKTRQLSIWNALGDIKEYAKADDLVIIHDAARPNLSEKFLQQCIDAAGNHDGVMPVLPMKDTVYFSEDGKKVSSLLDRSHIFAGQAPEIFRFNKYFAANAALLPERIRMVNGSTEPAILAGMDIALTDGEEMNFKITTQQDLQRFRDLMGE